MGRAFSPYGFGGADSRGDAPGWYEAAPSALIIHHANGAGKWMRPPTRDRFSVFCCSRWKL